MSSPPQLASEIPDTREVAASLQTNKSNRECFIKKQAGRLFGKKGSKRTYGYKAGQRPD